jgi:hypothetical protein
MRTKFDFAQWALANLPLAVASILLALALGYLLKSIWAENVKLRAERDTLATSHAAEIKQLNCDHQAALGKLRDENKALTDKYHHMAERNIDVLTALDRTINDANALPYLHELLPLVHAAIVAIGAELGLKPHQLK